MHYVVNCRTDQGGNYYATCKHYKSNHFVFLLSVVCFGLLCLCLIYSFERSQYVPAVAAAQIPMTANGVIIVFSSFWFDLFFAAYPLINRYNAHIPKPATVTAAIPAIATPAEIIDFSSFWFVLFLFVSLAVIT